MKIRLELTPDEVAAGAVEALREIYDVHEVSRPYRNRGNSVLVRVYVTAAYPPAPRPVRARATRTDQPTRRTPIRRPDTPRELEP
ncbi:hypothetical protein [Saccharothrix hoggarensis]|uniref:Uncharacterized protein n=1 Tax=Saccharothrix hoggarensis TaxID=913853 RepID=A0ABW3R7A4_9PSEU